jgi:hypothetical protein
MKVWEAIPSFISWRPEQNDTYTNKRLETQRLNNLGWDMPDDIDF